MDIIKQIKYWKEGAFDNLETAEILIDKHKFKEGLFFCHLTIEKLLKAHFVKQNNEFAPKTHNLLYLISKSNLKIDEENSKFIIELMDYQLEGRYPEKFPENPNLHDSLVYLSKTKELSQWLNRKLSN